MKLIYIFFGLAGLVTALYGIDTYSTNVACYEIIEPHDKFDTMLLDKCKGQAFLPVKEDVDEDGDGKMDGYSYHWTRMTFNNDGEVFWKNKK